MSPSKAEMVRMVVNEYGCQHTTKWVRKKIHDVFGVEITPRANPCSSWTLSGSH